jgi:gliding motility-associated-like protein
MKILSTLILSSLFFVGAFQAQFVKNMGQVVDEKGNPRNEVKFTVNNTDSKLFFQNDKITYVLYEFYNEETEKSIEAKRKGNFEEAEMLSLRIKQQTVDFLFLNSNENVELQFLNKQNEFQNYYNGNVSITNVELYEGVLYKNLYNNIDVVFKTSNGKIKYDIILHSGAKLSDIKFKYDGVDEIDFNKDKIIFKTKLRNLEENIPISFYETSGEQIQVNYKLFGEDVFGFESHFDEINETVIIDPTLAWATIMERTVSGGSSAIRGNITTDANGNFFYQINTYNPDLPIANPGGLVYLDPSYNPASGLDIYFAKFNINRTMVWSTYLGGTDGSQSSYYDHGLATYSNFFYICGETNSTNFPVLNQGGGAYYVGTAPSGQKGFLSKFDISTGQMLHSTYLNAYGQFVMDVNGVNGNVAVSSFNYTWSAAPNVLAKAGAYNQATHAGNSDIFLYEFNNSMIQIWGTFVGGASFEEPMGIQYDNLGNLFMFNRSGGTGSPVVNPGGGAYFDNSFADKYDFWLTRFNTSGAMTWSTYLGGMGLEGLSYSQVTCNSNNEVIFTSTTRSTVMPGVNPGGGAYFQTTPVGLTDGWGGTGTCAGFIMRFNNTGTLLHSTYIGENSTENYIQGQAIGNCNEHYLLFQARAFSTTPLVGSYNVNNANTAQYNYMVIKMNSNFGINWSSYVHSDSLFMERIHTDLNNGRLYTTGMVQARDYPFLNPGGGAYFDNTFSSAAPSYGYAIMELNIGEAPVITVSGGGPATICSGASITLVASGSGTINWWSAASGGTLLNTGTNYTFSPGSTITVYVESVVGGCASPRSPITVTVNSGPAAPIIGSNTPVCVGGTINLTANTIGSATYFWTGPNTFSSSSEDPSIPSATSAMGGTYSCYVQVAGCNSTTATTTVTVNTNSVAPTSITGTSTICSGGSTTLTLSGGTAGTGATAQWYSGSCGGTAVGTGNSISVSPTGTTTYFVRYEGTCNTTTCASVIVTVNSTSTAPTSITGTSTICSGSSTTLTLSGGTAGTGATANWYTGPNGTGSFVGTGSSVTVSPTSTITYYVRYEGTCNTTADASLTVTVNTLSVAPTSISGTSTICSGASTTLTLSGGTAGTGAIAQWFTGSCGGTAVGTGNSISVSPTATTTYFVRYSGTCNTTTCASVTVTVNTLSVAPTSITGTSTICSGASTTLTLSGGTAGTGATAQWFTGSCGGTAAGTGNSISVSPTVTTTYFVRYAGACNTTTCASVTVTVENPSVAPTSITGTSTICSGGSTTLTLSGGTAGTGATAQWFTGSCGGTGSGTGNSITVSPTVTTTYFVRYAGTCNTTTCASVTVTVNNAPATPGTISGTTPICNGTSNTYSISSVPTAVSYTWAYTGGGTPTGTGVSTTFSPTSSGTLTVTATNSCGTSAAQTLAITVNTAENASFTLSSNTQCQNGTNITATITGISGGTFSSTPAGLSLNASTGAINVAASTPNTYTVTYTTPGSCPGTTNTSVTINATQSSAFTLSSGTVCQNGANVTATIAGVAGGAFSSTAGLSLNTTTGAINVLASTPNTYNVTYTSPGPCASSTVQSITINAPDNAAFSYSGGTFCTSGTNPTPNITGLAGGTFTATPAGLSINASTGAINLAASTVNSYVVTYTTNGTCPNTATANINITNAPSAVFSYSGTPYCSNAGTANVTFGSGAGGGVFSATPVGLSINTSTGAINLAASTPNTYTVTNFIAAAGGCAPATATTTITVTAAESANFSLTSAAQCQNGTDITATITGTTGGIFTATPAGLSINASTGAIDVSASTGGTYTVTYTTPGTCSDAQNTSVTITTADNASFTLSSASVCQNGSDVTASISGTVGGTFSSTPAGLSLNTANGAIDVSASTAGTYNITYTTGGVCPSSSTSVITISATDNASFSYSGTTFCASGTNPTPTITGLAGGTFTATPAGLSLNASTGEITLATSTINNYVVTYTTNGSCPTTSTATINVTNSPSATFTYSSTSICGGSGTATVSFPIGASGGVFSATPTGLSINTSTGEIDLSASSPNTYTVTNFIAASGGCATATDNFTVTILPADDASFTFPAVSACQSLATYTPTISGTSGGSFTSSPAGLLINGTTGEVDLENSTAGNYTITYTTSGTCPDTESVSLEVLSSPIAPTVSVDNSVVCAGDPVIISATGSGGGVSYSVFSTLLGGTTLGTTPLTVNPTTTTNYFIEAFGTNGCGNIGGRQQITVTVNPLPTVSAGSDQTICPTESATLTATGSGSFVWSTTETTASIIVTPTITTTYTVTLTDGNSCSNTANVVVTVQSVGGSLTANDDAFNVFSGIVYIFDITSNDLNATSPSIISGPINGTATINASNNLVYTANPNYVGTDIITYTICDAFCANICDTAVVTITVSREIVIEVPGGFTPNGDNINDIFVIQGLDQYPNNELTIYNRWGSIVYSAKPYNNDWDGKSTGSGVIMGDYVTTGTYFYVLKLSEDQEPLKGSLEIKFN